jgi:hypothetical protein
MHVDLIDMRNDRRRAIEDLLIRRGYRPAPSRNRAGVAHAVPSEWPSVLLLHVGADQNKEEIAPSSVGGILDEYVEHCWILGYSGGAPCDEADTCRHQNFCLLQNPVNGLDASLTRAIVAVLQERANPTGVTLAELGKVINSFDFVLEAKLGLLVGLLNGGKWREDAAFLCGKGLDVANQAAEIAAIARLSDRVPAIGELKSRLFAHRS